MENRVAIELKNLSIGYRNRGGDTEILTGINASLLRGEFTCLIGSNGAGKSTLLRTIAGFLSPLAGEVIVEGKKLPDYSETRLAKIISVVLTDRMTLNNVSVRQVVEMGRSPYTGFWGTLGKEDRDAVNEAMAVVGISHLQNRTMDSLSDGERQKTMIAKALAQSTPIIILDEPSAFLDYPSKADLMSLLASLARVKNKVIFQSTHDLDIALQIADKVWMLDRDKGFTIGTPSALGESGALNRYFDRSSLTYNPASERFIVKT
ncbi:MAG: ABC transporter ATP-binding protein [Paramuribaculum sp.]|nr:ABC transporter ATP-binding protein [Paramuribaculum sp.]